MSDMRPTSPPSIGLTASSIIAPRLKIAVVANAGNTNLGDEAVLASTMAALRARLVDASICVYTVNPPDTAERHGVDSAPLRSRVTSRLPASRPRRRPDSLRAVVRRIPVVAPILRAGVRCIHGANRLAREPAFIVRSWRGLRETDLLMIAGSNQLEDWFGGPWGYPYTILLWTVLARLVGAPVAFVSVGAGPLSASLSHWMCVRALRLAAYASFRDAESLKLMRDLGYRGTGSVVPDLAFALALGEPEARPTAVPPRIAINVYPYRDPQYDPTETDGGASFAEYVDTFAGLVAAASARGLQPVLFGSQRADARVLDLVQERLLALAPDLGEVERHMPATLAGLIAVIDGSDFVVATRYHAILLAVFRGRPTIGICYQSKSRRLLEMAGLGEYAVDAEGVNAGALLDQVTRAIAAGDGNGHIHARAMALHAECSRGFDAALEKSLPGWIVASRVP
jgi:polysaccharide pyruvyl transferase WcaK-like protein